LAPLIVGFRNIIGIKKGTTVGSGVVNPKIRNNRVGALTGAL